MHQIPEVGDHPWFVEVCLVGGGSCEVLALVPIRANSGIEPVLVALLK